MAEQWSLIVAACIYENFTLLNAEQVFFEPLDKVGAFRAVGGDSFVLFLLPDDKMLDFVRIRDGW